MEHGTWEERGKLIENVGAKSGLAKSIGKLSGTAEAAVRVRIIGHFPAYLQLGEQLGDKVFSIPPGVWDKMTNAERWAANVEFLECAVAKVADFVLATPINQVRPGSALEKEIKCFLTATS